MKCLEWIKGIFMSFLGSALFWLFILIITPVSVILVPLLKGNFQLIYNIVIFIILGFVLTYIYLNYQRHRLVFIDNLKGRIEDNWEFYGNWHIENNNELSVSQSDEGGITKMGGLWENYIFEFDTKILDTCSSWIVRAIDINNYFMFQCNYNQIRAHYRKLITSYQHSQYEGQTRIQAVSFVEYPCIEEVLHNKNLRDKWFHVKVRVRGREVAIYIDDDLVYHNPIILGNSVGRIGFRNWGNEHAHFKNIKVTLI